MDANVKDIILAAYSTVISITTAILAYKLAMAKRANNRDGKSKDKQA